MIVTRAPDIVTPRTARLINERKPEREQQRRMQSDCKNTGKNNGIHPMWIYYVCILFRFAENIFF